MSTQTIRDGSQVVNVFASYSDDPSSHRNDVYNSANCLKRTKINKKEAGDGPFISIIKKCRAKQQPQRVANQQ